MIVIPHNKEVIGTPQGMQSHPSPPENFPNKQQPSLISKHIVQRYYIRNTLRRNQSKIDAKVTLETPIIPNTRKESKDKLDQEPDRPSVEWN